MSRGNYGKNDCFQGARWTSSERESPQIAACLPPAVRALIDDQRESRAQRSTVGAAALRRSERIALFPGWAEREICLAAFHADPPAQRDPRQMGVRPFRENLQIGVDSVVPV